MPSGHFMQHVYKDKAIFPSNKSDVLRNTSISVMRANDGNKGSILSSASLCTTTVQKAKKLVEVVEWDVVGKGTLQI